ncbi:MAG: DUF2142 domain-containing protein [Eubacterium sp.]|nr:DUF2142 domain-containing protein [Eubacterium sp.]
MIIALFWAMIIFVIRPFSSSDDPVTRSEIGSGEVLNVTDPITSSVTVEQLFVAKQSDMCDISVYFDTLGEQKYGKILFTLMSESGRVLAEEKIDVSTLKEKGFYTVSFDKIEESKGRAFSVRMTSTVNDASGGISIWYRAKDDQSNTATVNGDKLGGTLRLKVGYYDSSMQLIRIICWIVLIAASFVFAIFVGDVYEKNFILLAFLLGILTCFYNPFPHVIDEATHFFRSFMISQGDFYDDIYISRIGGNVSANYSSVVDSTLSIRSFYENPGKWLQSFSADKEFYLHPYMSSAIPINHMIAAVAIFVCRLFKLPAVIVILSGRLLTYLFYTIICYFAIKKAKYYKGMFFMIACLPVSIWLAGSYSIDPIVLSSALLYISICLRHFFDESLKLTWKERVALIVSALMVMSVKYLIYSPILLMILLIPRAKFKKKEYPFVWIIAGVMLIGILLWQGYMLNAFPFVEDRNGDVNVSRQIAYVMSNKISTARVFLDYLIDNTLYNIEGFSNSRGLTFISSIVGLMTVFGSVLEPDRYEFGEKDKKKRKLVALSLIILLICTMLIIASLYVGFTPVGTDGVEGIQTRYFLPILIFAMLPLSMIRIKNEIPDYRKKISLLMGIGIMDSLAGMLKQ